MLGWEKKECMCASERSQAHCPKYCLVTRVCRLTIFLVSILQTEWLDRVRDFKATDVLGSGVLRNSAH